MHKNVEGDAPVWTTKGEIKMAKKVVGKIKLQKQPNPEAHRPRNKYLQEEEIQNGKEQDEVPQRGNEEIQAHRNR